MNIDCFLKRFASVLMNEAGDDKFEMLKILTGGTTSPRIAKLLNFAVSQMNDKECYVEVGVFTGSTLCAAGYETGHRCIGIDKYDPGDIRTMARIDSVKVRDRCIYNLGALATNTVLIEKDFRKVTAEDIELPVAVSFIDGKHSYADVKLNLEWLLPKLADEAIIVFDDVNYDGVSKAIFEFTPKPFELLAYVKPICQNALYTFSPVERFINNGVAIFRYSRFQGPAWVVLVE